MLRGLSLLETWCVVGVFLLAAGVAMTRSDEAAATMATAATAAHAECDDTCPMASRQ